MFRKLIKFFLSLTLISGVLAAIYYIYQSCQSSEESVTDTMPDTPEAFDLDSDLEPIGKREYVPLNRSND
ncbi:MAG: hypothetical protein PHW34_02955 [Hespellia sp.]|nr:hypothetical protein [Hespellia sp.]